MTAEDRVGSAEIDAGDLLARLDEISRTCSDLIARIDDRSYNYGPEHVRSDLTYLLSFARVLTPAEHPGYCFTYEPCGNCHRCVTSPGSESE